MKSRGKLGYCSFARTFSDISLLSKPSKRRQEATASAGNPEKLEEDLIFRRDGMQK
jgi:hypothetical protein